MSKFLSKGFYILAIVFVFTFKVSAQIQWQQSYGGSLYESANSIIQTMDGGYIVFGVDSSCDGDVVRPCVGGYDLWIVKLSSVGAIQWQKSYGGSGDEEAYQIIQTKDKGYALAAIAFTPVPVTSGSFKGASDAWVLKLDSLGVIQWSKTYGGSGLDEATSIAQTTDGGFIVGGNSQSNDGDVTGHNGATDSTAKDDIWIIKLDSLGALQWQRSVGGTGDDGSNSIVQANDLGYVIVGNSNSLDGDLTGKGNKGYNDWIAVKLNSSGSLISWLKLYGGSSQDDAANSVKKTMDGGYIIAGATGSLDGDVTGNHGAACTAAECQDNDCWIVKIDSIGNLKWEKALGGTGNDNTFSIYPVVGGGYVLTAYTTSNDGDISGNNGLYDYWIAKIDTAGNLKWQQALGGTGNDQPFSVVQTSDGGYIVAGVSESNDGNVTGNHGNTDFWVVKLGAATGITDLTKQSKEVLIYPNPTTGKITLAFSLLKESSFKIEVRDVLGRTVYNSQKIIYRDDCKTEIDLSGEISGVYFATISCSGFTKTIRLLKN